MKKTIIFSCRPLYFLRQLHLKLTSDLLSKNCSPNIICLKETWNIIDSEVFPLLDYQPLIFTIAAASRGAGWWASVLNQPFFLNS